ECMIVSRSGTYHVYENFARIHAPSIDQLSKPELVDRDGDITAFLLDVGECEHFLALSADKNSLFSISGNDLSWYLRSEFIHESELVPIDSWVTRYIVSITNNDLDGDVDAPLTHGMDPYTLTGIKRRVLHFSDNG